jgi:hypothetical protein
MSGAARSRNRLSAVMVRCFPGAASRFRLGRAPAVARYRGQTSATKVPGERRLLGFFCDNDVIRLLTSAVAVLQCGS